LIIDNVEMKLEKILLKPIIVLPLIISISIIFRLYFLRFDFPLDSQDAFIYLLFSHAILENNYNVLPPTFAWSFVNAIFLAPFINENIYFQMNVIRVVSIAISIITIPIVYILAKNFTEKRYALLAVSFFAFDPNLIENANFGITEPLLILFGLISIIFLIKQETKYLIISALFAGLALDVRMNGIVFVIISIIIIVIRSKNNSKRIKNLIIIILFFSIAAIPFFIQSNEQFGNPLGTGLYFIEGVQNKVAPSESAESIGSDLFKKLISAIGTEILHIFRISIPYLVLFVPFGFIAIFETKMKNISILIITLIVYLIISIPQYTLSIEFRNLFFILPIFAIFGSIGIEYITKNSSKRNIFLILLVGGLLILSYHMLQERSEIDLELLSEKEEFGKYVAENYEGVLIGNLYMHVQHHIPNAIAKDEGCCVVSNEKLGHMGLFKPTKTIQDFIEFANDNGITHIIIENKFDERSPFTYDVYRNEQNYPFLKKTYDSFEENYNKLQVKIFKIDYTKVE
jgi:4-amino-4-deoxy-L-arabinose transferase-like glycosyltransferase